MIDRIDIQIEVPRLQPDELTTPPRGEASTAIRERVEQARLVQIARHRDADAASVVSASYQNAHLSARQIQRHCRIEPEARALLGAAIATMHLSARAYDRILKVSRTIADLAGDETIGVGAIAEAVQYRSLDRKLRG